MFIKHAILFLFLLFGVTTTFAQFNIGYTRFDSIPVIDSGDTLDSPWAGGLNAPIYSQMDFNQDGVSDLFVYDRQGGTIKTFINDGSTGTKAPFIHAPQYQKNYPEVSGFVQLYDYNCDGLPDLFTYGFGGIIVYENQGPPKQKFKRVTNPTIKVTENNIALPITIIPNDLAAINDIDNDGDLDILSFGGGPFGEINRLVLYRNLSVETYGDCRELIFEVADECWGKVEEGTSNNDITLNVSCKGITSGNGVNSGKHPGSSILAIDLDGDNDKELLIGDISFPNLVMLNNGGDEQSAVITSQDASYPSNNTSVDLNIFPSAYHFDGNNDGVNDLIVSPSTIDGSENFENSWFYPNTGSNSTPNFSFETRRWLADQMLDVGTAANPVFAEVTGDSLMDIVIGNFGYFAPGGVYTSGLALLENKGTFGKPAYELVSRDYAGLSVLGKRALDPTFGDLDFDGDIDLLVGDEDGVLHYYQNTALSGDPANFVLKTTEFMDIDVGQIATPHIAFVDNDTIPDLLIGERGGNVNYFKGEIDTAFDEVFFSDDPTNNEFGNVDVEEVCCDGHSQPILVDNMDSKGDRLLLVGSRNGKIYIYKVDTNLSAVFPLVDSIDTEGFQVSVDATDLTGNGRPELIIGEYAGGLQILRKTLDAPVTILPTGVKERKKITLFPNPAKTKLYISFTQPPSTTFYISIFDLLGKPIKENLLFDGGSVEHSIDISDLPEGAYLVRIQQGLNTTTSVFLKH